MTPSDIDALIERLRRYSILINGEFMMAKAAAALVQMRDSEALARDKIAEQMIEIERLRGKRPAYGPEHICPMCKGEKFIVQDSMGIDERMRCHFCGGTGVHRDRLTEQERAEAEVARLTVEFRKVEVLWKEAAIDASRKHDTIGGLKDEWRKECDDADDLCELLGLRSDLYRTEGGSLNLPRIKTALRERAEAERNEWKCEALVRRDRIAELERERKLTDAMLDLALKERDALKQDAERLDWVMKQFANWWPDRNAIDAARSKP